MVLRDVSCEPMNSEEAAALLRTRRSLTGETYSEETISAWTEALRHDDYQTCHQAMITAARTDKRVAIATIVAQLPPRPQSTAAGAHQWSCICAGRGWIEVEQTGRAGNRYLAWTPCPDGPRTGFSE